MKLHPPSSAASRERRTVESAPRVRTARSGALLLRAEKLSREGVSAASSIYMLQETSSIPSFPLSLQCALTFFLPRRAMNNSATLMMAGNQNHRIMRLICDWIVF